jgi:polar amino acid transport system substrate-binding protein
VIRWILLVSSGLWLPMVAADVIKVAVTLSHPPYVMSETNSGAELDIVREALALAGHELQPVYVPAGRLWSTLLSGQAEAAFPMLMTDHDDSSITFSDIHMRYRNAAFALGSRHLGITHIADLNHFSVLAFQRASFFLGDEFQGMASQNPDYSETARQQSQFDMLLAGRVDVVVMDEHIFHYYEQQRRQMLKDNQTLAEVEPFYLFPPSLYRVAFRGDQITSDFNRGLQMLHASGRYEQILEQYFDPH